MLSHLLSQKRRLGWTGYESSSQLPLRQHPSLGTQYAQASAVPIMQKVVKEKGENHGRSSLLLPQPWFVFGEAIMKVVKVVRTGESTFKPVCRFTLEDLVPLELQGKEFIVENMVSAKGFWFFVGPVLEPPGRRK